MTGNKALQVRNAVLAVLTAAVTFSAAGSALAHESGDHKKCPKGYVMNDNHKCVKKSK